MPIGRGSSAASRKETRTKETWLSRALSPASLLPGMVIGFFLGLWVELPKGGFSQGGSSPSSSYEEHHPKQRHSLKSKKGNAGERKLGNLGSGSSSSSSLPPESADNSGELKMVQLCFPSQILELLLFLMTNASRKQGGKFVFNWLFSESGAGVCCKTRLEDGKWQNCIPMCT
jgi:hypothetical protein